MNASDKVPWGLYGSRGALTAAAEAWSRPLPERPRAVRGEKVLLLQAGDIRAEIRHDDPFEQRLDALVDFVMAVSKKIDPSMDGL